ncbi:MAG: flagellar FlbD family protein [Candidatus Kapaibacteriales bacterium]
MILLTKVDGDKIVINAEEIETILPGQTTVVTLRSGKKFLVKEDFQKIIELVINYKIKCQSKFPNVENSQ